MSENRCDKWRKSSYSGETNCVEVGTSADGGLRIRDSKLATASPILEFAPAVARSFIADVVAGRFDR